MMDEPKTPQILSGFWLKMLGFFFMTLDHIGVFLMAPAINSDGAYWTGYVFRILGRIALPLFLFLAAEGARHSRNIWKYFFRLFVCQIAFTAIEAVGIYAIPSLGLTIDNAPTNAFADLSLLVLTIALLKQAKWKKLLALLPFSFAIMIYVIQLVEHAQDVTVIWFPTILRPGYSLFALLLGLGFYFADHLATLLSKPIVANMRLPMDVFKESKTYRNTVNILGMVLMFLIVAAFWGISYIGWDFDYRPYDTYLMQLQSYCMLALLPLFLYSGKRGYDSKPFRIGTYLYYPVHLTILLLIFSL